MSDENVGETKQKLFEAIREEVEDGRYKMALEAIVEVVKGASGPQYVEVAQAFSNIAQKALGLFDRKEPGNQ